MVMPYVLGIDNAGATDGNGAEDQPQAKHELHSKHQPSGRHSNPSYTSPVRQVMWIPEKIGQPELDQVYPIFRDPPSLHSTGV